VKAGIKGGEGLSKGNPEPLKRKVIHRGLDGILSMGKPEPLKRKVIHRGLACPGWSGQGTPNPLIKRSIFEWIWRENC